jgi:hypothetical protein
MDDLSTASADECRRAIDACIGCILRLGSRPSQSGDEETYDTARGIMLHQALPRLVALGDPHAIWMAREMAQREQRASLSRSPAQRGIARLTKR